MKPSTILIEWQKIRGTIGGLNNEKEYKQFFNLFYYSTNTE